MGVHTHIHWMEHLIFSEQVNDSIERILVVILETETSEDENRRLVRAYETPQNKTTQTDKDHRNSVILNYKIHCELLVHVTLRQLENSENFISKVVIFLLFPTHHNIEIFILNFGCKLFSISLIKFEAQILIDQEEIPSKKLYMHFCGVP